MALSVLAGATAANYVDTEVNSGNLVKTVNWYGWSWPYRKAIDITNTGAALSNYELRLSLNTTNAHFQAGNNDLRFTTADEVTELPYWIESGVKTATTIIWVRVTSIAATPTHTIIYMYYGNAGATAVSDGPGTFIFWDDFETWDAGLGKFPKWTLTGTTGSFTRASGAGNIQHGTYSAYFNKSADGTTTVTSDVFTTTVNPIMVQYYIKPTVNTANLQMQYKRSGTLGPDMQLSSGGRIQYSTNGSSWTNIGGTSTYSANVWLTMQPSDILWQNPGTDNFDIWVGLTPAAPTSRNTDRAWVNDQNAQINQIVFYATGTLAANRPKAYIDLVIVRQYTANTVGGTAQAEELL